MATMPPFPKFMLEDKARTTAFHGYLKQIDKWFIEAGAQHFRIKEEERLAGEAQKALYDVLIAITNFQFNK